MHVQQSPSQPGSVRAKLGYAAGAHEHPPPLHFNHETGDGRRLTSGRYGENHVDQTTDICFICSQEGQSNQSRNIDKIVGHSISPCRLRLVP
jgi:hypothetical protein